MSTQNKEKWEEEYEKIFPRQKYTDRSEGEFIMADYDILVNHINNLLASQKVEIEHCAEPKCPECNLAAYNKGKEDFRVEFLNQPANVHDQEVRRQVMAEIMEIVGERTPAEELAKYGNEILGRAAERNRILDAITSLTEKGDE